MSRTRGHNKAAWFGVNAGRDLWSKRPNSGSIPSKFSRKLTARIERQQEKSTLRKKLDNLEPERRKLVMDEADNLIREHIVLNEQDFDNFMESLDNPPEPSEALTGLEEHFWTRSPEVSR